MSHIATYAASLGQVNENLLKQALEIVAKKFGGQVVDSIKDYYGKNLTSWDGSPITAGIQTPSVKRGIGITMKNGILQFVGDNYGCENKFSELRKEIELTYKKLALAKALKESGYEIEVAANAAGTIFQGRRR